MLAVLYLPYARQRRTVQFAEMPGVLRDGPHAQAGPQGCRAHHDGIEKLFSVAKCGDMQERTATQLAALSCS